MKENVRRDKFDKTANFNFWKFSSLKRKDSLFERLGGLKKDRLFWWKYSVLGGASLSFVESPDSPLDRVTERGKKVSVPPQHPPGLLHVVSQLIQVPRRLELGVEKTLPLTPV